MPSVCVVTCNVPDVSEPKVLLEIITLCPFLYLSNFFVYFVIVVAEAARYRKVHCYLGTCQLSLLTPGAVYLTLTLYFIPLISSDIAH
jgi:hypothetical protein